MWGIYVRVEGGQCGLHDHRRKLWLKILKDDKLIYFLGVDVDLRFELWMEDMIKDLKFFWSLPYVGL
jgi:hypothetical protein